MMTPSIGEKMLTTCRGLSPIGMPEASTRPILATRLVKRLLGLTVAGLRLAVDLDRDEAVFEELALGLVVLSGVLEVDGRGLVPVANREQVLRLVDIGLDAGDELALLDHVAGANREIHDAAGEVRLDLDLDLRLDRADLAHHHLDVVDIRRQVRDLGALFVFAVAVAVGLCCKRHGRGCDHNHGDENQPTFLFAGHCSSPSTQRRDSS